MSRIHRRRSTVAVVGAVVLGFAVANSTDAAAKPRPAKPVVSKVAPAYGPAAGGSRVTVTGRNFSKVRRVTFGGTAGRAIKVLSKTRLQVTAPRHSAGYIDVRVMTPAGWSTVTRADRFRAVAAPTVRRLSAVTGSTSGGNSITVTGANFVAVRSVLFGAKRSAAVTVRSEGTLVARVPAAGAGTVHVRVVTAAGTSPAVSTDRYSYRTPLPPGTWRAAELTTPRIGGIADVSCPSNDFCAAVDGNGAALTYSAGTWSAPRLIDPPKAGQTVNGALTSVSCVTSSFCVAGGYSGTAFRWDGSSWSKASAYLHGTIDSAACASVTDCFLTVSDDERESDDQLLYFDGTTWTQDDSFGGDRLGDVTCTLGGSCRLLHSGSLSRWDGTWHDEAEPPATNFTSLTCPVDTSCVGVTADATSYTLSNGAWTGPTPIPGADTENGYVGEIRCSTATHCFTDDLTSVFSYDGSDWSTVPNLLRPAVIACSPSTCSMSDGSDVVALDQGAPAGKVVDARSGGVNDVDCAGTACVAVGDGGRVSTLKGLTWATGQSASTDDLSSVSCPTTTWCLAVGVNGTAETYDGSTWTALTDVPADVDGFDAVSCASNTYCVVMNGDVAWTYINGRWTSHRVTTTDHGFPELDCAAPAFCAVFLANRYATVSNGTWTTTKTLADGAEHVSLSCASPTMCIAASNASVAYRWNGTAWTKSATLFTYSNFTGFDVSCPSTSACKVSTGGYNGPNDYVQSGVWDFNGTSWSAQRVIALQPDRLSCSSVSFCVAGQAEGFLQIYR